MGRRWGIIPTRGVYQGLAFSGVYADLRRQPASISGSSPLARGLHTQYGYPPVTLGIIPARAGFTHGGLLRLRALRDHPRSRGVYWCQLVVRAAMSGSSPLARGLLGIEQVVQVPARIIPARAGFTRS